MGDPQTLPVISFSSINYKTSRFGSEQNFLYRSDLFVHETIQKSIKLNVTWLHDDIDPRNNNL